MADWEGLHHDLLILIAKKIELIKDFVVFGAVCKSWNEVASNKKNLRPQIPWLMLAENEDTENHRRQIYSLYKGEILSTKGLHIPHEMADRKCIGLNYGWVLTISRSGDMNLVNPLSRSHIELPNQKSIAEYDERETSPTYLFTRRAALSANPAKSSDFVLMIVHTGGAYLGYWRLGDKSWTRIEQDVGSSDLIYYKDQFYAISYDGCIWACQISCSSDPTILRLITKVEASGIKSEWPYIVGSGDALLVVSRNEHVDYEDMEEVQVPDHIAQLEDVEDDTRMSEDFKYGVVEFKVYEVDLIKRGWKPIKSFGDIAIFVGHSTSM